METVCERVPISAVIVIATNEVAIPGVWSYTGSNGPLSTLASNLPDIQFRKARCIVQLELPVSDPDDQMPTVQQCCDNLRCWPPTG